MYKMHNIPIQMNGILHTFIKTGKAIKPPDFKWNFWQNRNFQKIACSHLVYSFQNSWILVDLIIPRKTKHFKAPSSGHQNEPFQWISCKISKEGLSSFIVLLETMKMTDFQSDLVLFTVSQWKMTFSSDNLLAFQKRCFQGKTDIFSCKCCTVHSISMKITGFSWNALISVKITDFPQFSKESLLPFGLSVRNIPKNRFPVKIA